MSDTSGSDTPGYETPGSATPGSATPGSATPDYEMPDYEMPDYEMPDYEMPGYEAASGEMLSELDPVAAERLLRGDYRSKSGSSTVDDPVLAPLARLLDAAAAPGTSDELRRVDAVVAAYAARPRRRGFWQRLVGVKLLAAVAAATAAGGLAVAAGTGVLPSPLYPRPDRSHAPASAQPASSVTARPGTSPSAASPASAAPPSAPPSLAAAASLQGLCKAYLDGTAQQRDKQLTTPALAGLVAAAGGTAKVEAYCVALVGPPKTHSKPSAHPSHPDPGNSSPAPSPQ